MAALLSYGKLYSIGYSVKHTKADWVIYQLRAFRRRHIPRIANRVGVRSETLPGPASVCRFTVQKLSAPRCV